MGEKDLATPMRSRRTCQRVWTWFTLLALLALLLFCMIVLRPPPAARAKLPGAVVLRNKNGVEVHVLPTGAVIHRLLLPDRDGQVEDVVLGMATEASYSDGSSPYFGAIVGRFANRIANASFVLDGRTHRLNTNEGGFPGSLHGGTRGFDKVKWSAKWLDPNRLKNRLRFGLNRRRGEAVHLRHASPDGEEGYPGRLDAQIVYTLTDGVDGESVGELIQTVTATTDAPTVVNMAQHSYFNLRSHAHAASVLEHELTMHTAEHVLPVDTHRIPTGHMLPVASTPFDFTSGRPLGAAIQKVDGPGWRAGYDHCFVLHGLGGADGGAHGGGRGRARRKGGLPPPAADEGWWQSTPKLAATLRDPASGRTMEIATNAPGLQLYTSNFLDGTLRGTKDGALYEKYAGVCLETQSFPDGPNRVPGAYPTGVLRPGEEYRHVTSYKFSAR